MVSGTASIAQIGNVTDIRQSSADLSINWLSFSIGSQETVDFLQPSASAVAVNRILGTNGTQILGHLDADGEVYLVNPNGVIFGKGAEVNVGGLVASTLDVSDSSLSASTRSFSGDGAGSVTNQGTINAANGGYVALLGNRVSNQGVITAQLGTVALGAGSAVTLDFSGNRLVHLQVDRSTLNDLAENKQLIQADGGLVIMTAGAQRALLASVVNNSGIIEARTVANHDGTIELLGGMTAGTVNVGGTLDASAPEGGNGGFIETNAAHVEVANDAKVTTAASKGLYGTWLIDPTDFTVSSTGGDITGATLSSDLNSTNFAILSSSGTSTVTGGGSGGNINVNDAVSWTANTTLTLTAANNVNVNGSITASGATAGLVIQPNAANGSEAASGTGTLNLGAGASITLSGANAGLSISTSSYTLGSGATVNLPNVSATSTTALVIGGTSYTVINSLGAPSSTTGQDLQGINGNLTGNYALGSNINASATSTWNSKGGSPPVYAGFTPIGNASTQFTGTFDGLGHSISNLTINLPSTNYVGLFGYTGPGSVIRNVGLIGGSVSGSNYVGELVGQDNGTVSNSYATGNVSGTNNVGGLVGYNYGGTVSNSYATGNVSGTDTVGGLVGYNYGTVGNSYATGSVHGSTFVGGLVGLNYVTISNSYATGSVSGSGNDVGGLVGYNYGFVGNSYATGSVHGSNDVGGLVGHNYGFVSNSHATGSANGSSYVGGLVGYQYGRVGNSYATGSVSGSGNDVGGLVGYNYGPVGAGLVSVGNSYATGSVSGTNNVGGLVGVNNYGTISNSYATGSVRGANNVGGLVGSNSNENGYSSAVSNSYATGHVSGTNNVGGLVGSNYGTSATISNSYAAGSVSGSVAVGGLVGYKDGGTVSNSFWDTRTSGQASSAGGTGLTTAQMQSASNFTGWSIAITGGSGDVWRIYEGHTTPLLISFLTPLTLADAADRTVTYNGHAQSGPTTSISGVLGAAATGTNAGFYNGYYSTQQGYDITGGNLTINQLASVAWVGGATGNWSTASNWAGGAIPDLSNVAAVTIPKGTTVTYNAGVVGTTILTTLTDSGKLVMAAGDLSTTGNLSTAGYTQSGGLLDVGGTLSINSITGAVTLGDIDAGALSVASTKGAITQLAATALDVTGAASLTADNGLTGASEKRYAVTLAQAGDSFGGTVRAKGSAITLKDKTALTAILNGSGATTLTAAGALNVSGVVGTKLTTKTTGGTGSTTTFGKTTVGTALTVTSTGAVRETSSNILKVAGAATTTAPNPKVCVNGKCDVKIPAP